MKNEKKKKKNVPIFCRGLFFLLISQIEGVCDKIRGHYFFLGHPISECNAFAMYNAYAHSLASRQYIHNRSLTKSVNFFPSLRVAPSWKMAVTQDVMGLSEKYRQGWILVILGVFISIWIREAQQFCSTGSLSLLRF